MDQPAVRAYGDIQAIMKAHNINGPHYEKGDHISCLIGESFVASFKGVTNNLVGKAREIIEDQGIVGRMAVRVNDGDLQLLYRGHQSQAAPTTDPKTDDLKTDDADVVITVAQFGVSEIEGKPAFMMSTPMGRMVLLMEINQAEEIREALNAAIRDAKSKGN